MKILNMVQSEFETKATSPKNPKESGKIAEKLLVKQQETQVVEVTKILPPAVMT